MQSVTIRDLKNNPSTMTKYLDEGSSVFVTRHGKPIGITLPLNDDIFSIGVKKTVAIELYKMNIISLGKMAEMLEIPKQEAMSLLNTLGVVWIEDDIETIKAEANRWL
jgi:predicted HTH domain antitoxin